MVWFGLVLGDYRLLWLWIRFDWPLSFLFSLLLLLLLPQSNPFTFSSWSQSSHRDPLHPQDSHRITQLASSPISSSLLPSRAQVHPLPSIDRHANYYILWLIDLSIQSFDHQRSQASHLGSDSYTPSSAYPNRGCTPMDFSNLHLRLPILLPNVLPYHLAHHASIRHLDPVSRSCP